MTQHHILQLVLRLGRLASRRRRELEHWQAEIENFATRCESLEDFCLRRMTWPQRGDLIDITCSPFCGFDPRKNLDGKRGQRGEKPGVRLEQDYANIMVIKIGEDEGEDNQRNQRMNEMGAGIFAV